MTALATIETNQVSRYEAARAALSEAKTFPEAKDIHDVAAAMKAYARQVKDKEMLADAEEIRYRALRKMDELRWLQAETIGLNQGVRWVGDKPAEDDRPTLESQGIDKNLAHRMRLVGALSVDELEDEIAKARKRVKNTADKGFRSTIKHAENESKVAPDVLSRIKGTPLDTENYVELLSRLSHDDQRQRVNEALVTAPEPVQPDEIHQRALLLSAWERASAATREWFIEHLRAEGAIS